MGMVLWTLKTLLELVSNVTTLLAGAKLMLWLLVVSEKILARDPMDEMRRAFELFDDDKTGKISIRNLRRVAKELNEHLDEDELYVPQLIPTGLVDISCLAQASDDR